MKIFVTGGAGYIGSVVTETLLDSGHDVVVYDSFETGHRAAVDPRAALVEGDTADADGLRAAMRAAAPDAVAHMAAYIQMGESMTAPGKYFRNNTAHTLNVLDAMLAADARHVVFSSTAGVYGTPQSLPIAEDHPLDPLNPYSESKRQVESVIRWYAQAHGLAATIFRFFNAAGATARFGEDHRPESHLIPIVLQVAQGTRERLDLYGTDYPTRDGTASRDYIHVRDLAQAHLLAIEGIHPHPNPLPPGRGDAAPGGHGDPRVARRGNDGEGNEAGGSETDGSVGGGSETGGSDGGGSGTGGSDGGGVAIYNIGSESGATNREVIETARRVTGRPIPVRECPRRPGDAPASLASAATIRRELGWEPAYSDLETIMRTAWDWLQRHPRGYDSVPPP